MNRAWRLYTATYRTLRRVAPFWRVRRVTRSLLVTRSADRIGPVTYDAYNWHGRLVVSGARTPAEALDWARRHRYA